MAACASSDLPVPDRCGFYIEKKKRFCKMVVGNGKRFCGEHANVEGDGSRRIVCPLDPKHTVSEDKLDKHLKKCNSREKPKPVYYVKNINAGPADTSGMLHEGSLCDCSRAQLETLVDKLRMALTGLQFDMENRVLSHPVLQKELNDPKNGVSAYKHLKQQSSILGHLEDLGLLGGGRCIIEFGAGRGKLSYWIHEALKTCRDLQLVLVERCTTRFKMDGKHQDVGVQFERLQVDIEHLDLSKVPLIRHKNLPLVAVGKHLCGAATDLSLRCLLETAKHRAETEPTQKRLKASEPGAEPNSVTGSDCASGPVLGLALALCCHHRCEWRHYVGQQFFLQRGLGAAEFSAFCRMSSWATCGSRRTDPGDPVQSRTSQRGEDEEHEAAEEKDTVTGFLSAAEREELGRLCKLLIDSGRLDFLQKSGFNCKLTHYVDPQVTLENVLLTAVPKSSHQKK